MNFFLPQPNQNCRVAFRRKKPFSPRPAGLTSSSSQGIAGLQQVSYRILPEAVLRNARSVESWEPAVWLSEELRQVTEL